MKSAITTLGLLALASAASTTETHITAAETAVPSKNNDPWDCPLQNIPSYLTGGPSPTGTLSSALSSYEDKIYETCRLATTVGPCQDPARSVFCSFSAAIPTTLLSAYSSYASSAASWWSAGNGDKVVSLVKECPYLWYDSLLRYPGSGFNLNRTVAHAQCWAEAHPTGSGELATLSATGASTKASTGSGVKGSTPTPTPTGNGGMRSGAVAADSWMMAGSGMGMAAAMNVGLL